MRSFFRFGSFTFLLSLAFCVSAFAVDDEELVVFPDSLTETIISDSASSASVLSDDSLTVDTSVSPDAVYTGLEDDESSQEGGSIWYRRTRYCGT